MSSAGADLLDLFVEVVEALDSMAVEAEMIGDIEQPVSPEIAAEVEKGAAAIETLRWLLGQPEMEKHRPAAEAKYREELVEATCILEMKGPPVLDETRRHVAAVQETVRRRAIVDPAFAAALRGAELRSDYAGC